MAFVDRANFPSLVRPEAHQHHGSELVKGSVTADQLAADSVGASEIAAGAVGASELAAAIPLGQLGYAEVTATQGSITGAATDLTGLSIAVTVAASRRIRIVGECMAFSDVTDDTARLHIQEGGTVLQLRQVLLRPVTVSALLHAEKVIIAPSAGAHTYKLTMNRAAGTGTLTMDAGAIYPAFVLVEDIGSA